MSASIPLSVSSKVNVPSDEVRSYVVTPTENEGATSVKAPYLITIESEGTVSAEEFAVRMVNAGGQGTEAQARLAINALSEVLADLVEEYEAFTAVTPFGTIETYINGSISYATEEAHANNYAYLGLVLPEVIRNQIAAIETYVPTSSRPVTAKRIRDKETGDAAIYGYGEFYLEGKGMTYGGEGEKLEFGTMADEVLTKVCDIDVLDHSNTGLFRCKLKSCTAAKGKYYVMLTCAAGTDKLWSTGSKVELKEACAPLVPSFTKMHATGQDERMTNPCTSFEIEGANLDLVTNISFQLDGNEWSLPATAQVTKTASKITIADSNGFNFGQTGENTRFLALLDWAGGETIYGDSYFM